MKKRTTTEFIDEASKVHNGKYDYSKVDYKGNHDKVCIICPEHGEFWQEPAQHLKGQGCPYCSKYRKRYTTELIIDELKKKHGDKLQYDKIVYNGAKKKIILTCPTHGDFLVYPYEALHNNGCPYCVKKNAKKRSLTDKVFIERSRKIHGDKYDYSKVNYVNYSTKVCITCPEHGDFWQMPVNHLAGKGCPECAKIIAHNNLSYTKNEFIEKAKEIHGDKYDYSKVEYYNSNTPITIICPIHGKFKQIPYNHISGYGCPKCGHSISNWEDKIASLLGNNEIEIIRNNRSILNGKEIDIYIPDNKIGIECDGLYWHSDKFCDKNYQLNKTFLCEQNGIRLIHIFEDEWNFHQEIVKSMLLDILDKIDNKIEAQKCQIKAVSSTESDSFYNYNHIEGKCNSVLNFGLYNDDTLVYLMSFNKAKDSNCYKITRFSSKIGVKVINGANMLLNYFISKFKPNKVTAYVDKRWQNGDMFLNMNFKHICDTLPTCYDIFQRKRNVNKGNDNELNKIYDCGNMVFVWQ